MNNESIQDTKTRADINSSVINIANEGFKYMLAVSGGAIALAISNYDRFPFKAAVILAIICFILSLFWVGRCLQNLWFHQYNAIAVNADNLRATSMWITQYWQRSLWAFVVGCGSMMIALLPLAVTIQIL
jgi:hypothetical protein